MELFINNERRTFDSAEADTLEVMFVKLRIESWRGIAVAVNDNVIPKTEWKTFQLNDKDRITLIRATQGG